MLTLRVEHGTRRGLFVPWVELAIDRSNLCWR